MSVPTCCLPATVGVTAGILVGAGLGYCRKDKGKAEGSHRALRKSRTTATESPSRQKAEPKQTGPLTIMPGKDHALPEDIQARMDGLRRTLEIAIEEKQVGPGNGEAVKQGARQLLVDASQAEAGGQLASRKAIAPATTAQGLDELLAELASTERNYAEAEKRIQDLESKLSQVELMPQPREEAAPEDETPSKASAQQRLSARTTQGLDELLDELENTEKNYAQAMQRVHDLELRLEQVERKSQPLDEAGVKTLGQLQEKEKVLNATKAVIEEREQQLEELRSRAQQADAKEADLQQYQELAQAMTRTAELREAEVKDLGQQLGEAQAEMDLLLKQKQETEVVLAELRAAMHEQQQALTSSGAGGDAQLKELLQRSQDAENHAKMLERQMQEQSQHLDLHVQEKERHLQALTETASEHAFLLKRVDDLERLLGLRENEIRQLQEASQQNEAVDPPKHELLMNQAVHTEEQIMSLNASLAQLQKQAEDDKATLQAQLKMEMEKAELLEKLMREAEAEGDMAKRMAAAAQSEVAQLRNAAAGLPIAAQESADALPSEGELVQIDEGASPRSLSSSFRGRNNSQPSVPTSSTRNKLTPHELQALQARLKSAENRLKAEEAKKLEMESEIAMLREASALAPAKVGDKELAALLEAERSSTRQQLDAQGEVFRQKLEAEQKTARLQFEVQAQDFTKKLEAEREAAGLQLNAQGQQFTEKLQAERDLLKQQLDAQGQAFNQKLEEATMAARSGASVAAVEAEERNKLLMSEVATLKAELLRATEAKGRVEVAEEKNQLLTSELATLRAEMSRSTEMEESSRQLASEVALLQAELARAQEKDSSHRQLESEVVRLQAELARAREQDEVKDLSSRRLESEVARLQAELAQAQAFAQEAAAVRPAVEAAPALESENKLLRGEVAALKTELAVAMDQQRVPSSKGSTPSRGILGVSSREALLAQATSPPSGTLARAAAVSQATSPPSGSLAAAAALSPAVGVNLQQPFLHALNPQQAHLAAGQAAAGQPPSPGADALSQQAHLAALAAGTAPAGQPPLPGADLLMQQASAPPPPPVSSVQQQAARRTPLPPGQRLGVAPAPLQRVAGPRGGGVPVETGAKPLLASRPVLMASAKASGAPAGSQGGASATQRPRRASAGGMQQPVRQGRTPASQADAPPREPVTSLTKVQPAAAAGGSRQLSMSMPGGVLGSTGTRRSPPGNLSASSRSNPLGSR